MTGIAPRDLDFGRYFSAEEDQCGAHVAVIGNNVAGSLFPSGNAVNRTMTMDGAEYIGIGVYAKAKGEFFGENGQDNAVDVPANRVCAAKCRPNPDVVMILNEDLGWPLKAGFEVLTDGTRPYRIFLVRIRS